MSVIYKLTTPCNVGTLIAPRTVSALAITSIYHTTTPKLAPLGAGEMEIVLTETTNGWQETITYQDASVVDFWTAPLAVSNGQTVEDALSVAIFNKLIADSKLPAGTVSVIYSAAAQGSVTIQGSATTTHS